MPGATVPQILYQQWFWFAILAVVLVSLHLARKKYPPAFPRTGAFLTRHKVGIEKTLDFFVISFVVLSGGVCLFLSAGVMIDALRADPAIRAVDIRCAWSFGLITMICWSSEAAFLFGILTRFHRNLTRRKRILLLALCLLPGAFTAGAVAVDFADMRWLLIQLGVIGSLPGWVVNAPPILARKHFLDFVWPLLRKLHLVPRDSSP